MNIAIYDTVHLDWIIPYAELLAEEDLSVGFITSSNFKNDLKNITDRKNPRFTWYFIDPRDRVPDFAKKMYAGLKSRRYDLVILNSVDSRHLIVFIILMLLKPQRILINLHDINNFFLIKPSLSIRTNIRSAGKKLLMHLAHGYIVNAEAMRIYLLKKNLTKKPVYRVQPVYFQPSFSTKKTTFLHSIVIPGSIDKRRRNYALALEVIQEMHNHQIPVSWVLAGKPEKDYGGEIIEMAKNLNRNGAKICFYTEEIPEDQFQQIIADCTLILSPLVSSTAIHDDIPEIYGESKGSGNVYDAIRHAKPLIIPAAVTVPKEIVTSCVRYQSKDHLVQELIRIFINSSLLDHYKQKAEENSKYFTKERIKNMLLNAVKNNDV